MLKATPPTLVITALRFLALLLVLLMPAAAQTIVVKTDGTKVSGNIVEEDFDFIVIQTADGEQVKILADDIKDIHYPDPDRESSAELEDAGTGGTDRPRRPELTHQQEWPREPATPLEKRVWELGPKIMYEEDEDVAAQLLQITTEGFLPLCKELLEFAYTAIPEEQDSYGTLWRTTLATALGRSGDESMELYGEHLTDEKDVRKQHDGMVILKHFNSPSSAQHIFNVFVENIEEVPESQRPRITDIVMANEEEWNEAMDDLEFAYQEQGGLAGMAEETLHSLGKNALAGASLAFRGLRGEKQRAAIHLIARLANPDRAIRNRYNRTDEESAEIAAEGAKILVPALGRDRDLLVDVFFAVNRIGEPCYPFLIPLLKGPSQREWAGRALRRISGEDTPSSYDRWLTWYRRRYGQ